MSVKVLSRVWKHSRAKNATLLVLLRLADYADDDGVAWPSEKTLADECRVSLSSVKKAIAALKALGEIEVYEKARPIKTKTRGFQMGNQYVVKLAAKHGDVGQNLHHVERSDVVDNSAQRGAESRADVVQNRATVTVSSDGESSEGEASLSESVVQAWNTIAQLHKLPEARMTDARAKTIRRRLEDRYWRDNWRDALATIGRCPFLLGHGPNGWRRRTRRG